MVTYPPIDFILAKHYSARSFISDNELRRYLEVRQHLDARWMYYDAPPTVNTNAAGFRMSQEMHEVDWTNTIAVVGCSYVYGQGVYEDHTISNILTSMGIPAVNLGVPGASNRDIHNNAICVQQRYSPRAVVIIWTHAERNTWTYGTSLEESWNHVTVHPANPEFKPKYYRKEFNLPDAYLDAICHNTHYDRLLYRSIHDLLGHIHFDHIFVSTDIIDFEPGYPQTFEGTDANYEVINGLYAADFVIENGVMRQAHWGVNTNTAIAEKIKRDLERR